MDESITKNPKTALRNYVSLYIVREYGAIQKVCYFQIRDFRPLLLQSLWDIRYEKSNSGDCLDDCDADCCSESSLIENQSKHRNFKMFVAVQSCYFFGTKCLLCKFDRHR